MSLKPDRVNVRGGPTRDHDVAWVYTRAGLPVEITAESENWRRIRDWEGAEGWVYHSMLTGRRTALVKAKEKDALVPLQAKPDASSEVVAKLQTGVLGTVKACTGTWCRIFGTSFDGWVACGKLAGGVNWATVGGGANSFAGALPAAVERETTDRGAWLCDCSGSTGLNGKFFTDSAWLGTARAVSFFASVAFEGTPLAVACKSFDGALATGTFTINSGVFRGAGACSGGWL